MHKVKRSGVSGSLGLAVIVLNQALFKIGR
jgi:hypothetical protein